MALSATRAIPVDRVTLGWTDEIAFLTMMIPLIRWDDVLLRPEEMAPAKERLARRGRGPNELRAQYRALDPIGYRSRLPTQRISVLVAEHDQVAHAGPLGEWLAAWGIDRVHTYDRGHATILFTPSLYGDYSALLAEDLEATQGEGAAAATP